MLKPRWIFYFTNQDESCPEGSQSISLNGAGCENKSRRRLYCHRSLGIKSKLLFSHSLGNRTRGRRLSRHLKWRFVSGFSVRVGRIELPPDAWEASILPLNYTRICTTPFSSVGLGKHMFCPKSRRFGRDPDRFARRGYSRSYVNSERENSTTGRGFSAYFVSGSRFWRRRVPASTGFQPPV